MDTNLQIIYLDRKPNDVKLVRKPYQYKTKESCEANNFPWVIVDPKGNIQSGTFIPKNLPTGYNIVWQGHTDSRGLKVYHRSYNNLNEAIANITMFPNKILVSGNKVIAIS